MDPTDEMIMILKTTVEELKKGITEYSARMKQAPQQNQHLYYEYIKEMHQIALQIDEGAKGLEKLKNFKNKLSKIK